MPETITYKNQRGQEYFLCEIATKRGKSRYVFSRQLTGRPLTEIPGGYEIAESVNGLVSLRKVGSTPIRADEIECVRAALAKDPALRRYRFEARKLDLLVYEPIRDLEEVAQALGLTSAAILEWTNRVRYTPVLRFTLIDARKRLFVASRMCYRSSIDGWLPLSHASLPRLLERYLPHLGKDTFFDLM